MTSPTPVITITDHSPPVQVDPRAGDPDPARVGSVPEHLRADYLAATVPLEVLVAAAAGKMQSADTGNNLMPDTFESQADRARWLRARSFTTLTVADAVHAHRLTEAQRAHDQRQRDAQTRAATMVACPVCGQHVDRTSLGELHQPAVGTISPGTLLGTACAECRLAWTVVTAEHLANTTLPDGTTRRQALLTLLH